MSIIDLRPDSGVGVGVGAMSDRQWSGLMMGDESYAGSRNVYHLRDTVEAYYSYKYTVPTHPGCGAEHLLSQIMIKAGNFVPENMYFTSTRQHQELAAGTFVDIIINETHPAQSDHPCKGNVDFDKLEQRVNKVGAE